ncbi:MAG: MotA/TolQ/ExbB proton channel family protein [Isosphaeraceae bacterium]
MQDATQGPSRTAYGMTLGLLLLAFAFPIGLMVFEPTLMFERGWEQYAGTSIYFWAVFTLARELRKLWRDELAFDEAPELLAHLRRPGEAGDRLTRHIPIDETRVLPARVRQLAAYLEESRTPSVSQLMEINREGSALDQEHASGRFTLTRYILYLLPVIGFIGTVEGISKALMNISKVLPMVKDLDGFMSNLTSVTSALQVAFDSTLLALFLSASLMFAQTLVYRRAEELLARVDRWVVGHLLPIAGFDDAAGSGASAASQVEQLRRDLAGVLQQFATSVERLPASMAGFQRGAESIGRIGADLEAIGTASDSLRRGVATLGRIENALEARHGQNDPLADIRRGIDRNVSAVETLANSMALSFERSNRASQEQLARTMQSLKEALDMLQVSMEQSNALYRNIVRKMFHTAETNPRLFSPNDEAA